MRADPALGVVAGDISMPGGWTEQATGCDTIVHTAAVVSMRRDPEPIWRINALGTRRVVDAARAAGVARLVHLSSVTAYSFDFPDGVTEEYPVRSNGVPYVDTKVVAEQVVFQAHAAGEVGCTVLRPGDVYGPGSRPWTVLPVQAIAARRFVLPAMGRGIFSPLYVDDLVEGIVTAAGSDAAAGRVFNLTAGEGVTTARFFGHYGALLGRRIPVAPTAVARALAGAVSALADAAGRPTEINAASAGYLARRGTYSIAAAREVLGYRPAVSLDEGMDRTANWLRAEGLV
jgi:nucleoside-diphosphate-sugar epimerase